LRQAGAYAWDISYRRRFCSPGKIEYKVPPPYLTRRCFGLEEFVHVVPPRDVPLLGPDHVDSLFKPIQKPAHGIRNEGNNISSRCTCPVHVILQNLSPTKP
jgi:hypothetical protein